MQARVGNIQTWWELAEKYEQELIRVERWDSDDDEGEEGFGETVTSDEVRQKEKKAEKAKKKKNKKAKKAKKSEDEVKEDL